MKPRLKLAATTVGIAGLLALQEDCGRRIDDAESARHSPYETLLVMYGLANIECTDHSGHKQVLALSEDESLARQVDHAVDNGCVVVPTKPRHQSELPSLPWWLL
jgi:hypothetical protein